MMDEYLQILEDLPPVEGQERVLYAGLMEEETTIERMGERDSSSP